MPSKKSGKRALRERIERERSAYARKFSDYPVPLQFLNNFHGHLPGGFYRTALESEDLNRPCDDPRAGPKRRGMTLAQLHALIDRLIPEVGLDVETIMGLQAARNGSIYDYVFPLYVRLREEGFRHYPDLTS